MGIAQTKRQSVWFTAPRVANIEASAIPFIGEHEVLVQTAVSAISAGTELLIYRGEAPNELMADESIDALDGRLSFPLKYGYGAVGRVIKCGDKVDFSWLGRTVFAFNPHESHFVAQPAHLQLVPKDLPLPLAALLPNMETAVSFLMDSRPVIGERVVIFGQGIVGLLTTLLMAQLPLAQVVTVDLAPRRRALSRQLGATHAVSPEELMALLPPERADLTLELSGSPAALAQAIEATGDNGRLLIGSWYGDKSANLPLGGRFHRSQMQLVSSQVSRLAPQHRGRWSKARRLQTAWHMLQQHRPEMLITHRLPFEQAAVAYELLDNNVDDVVQVILDYDV